MGALMMDDNEKIKYFEMLEQKRIQIKQAAEQCGIYILARC